MLKKHKNQFLHYRSTRNFMVKPNLKANILTYTEQLANMMRKGCHNGGLQGHYMAVCRLFGPRMTAERTIFLTAENFGLWGP